MTGEAAASGLRFFLDRGLGSQIVPNALRRPAWVLETMDERYGKAESQKIKDAQWVEEASLAGDILLNHGSVVSRNETKLVAAAIKARGPYVMSVNPSYGLRRVKLAYPPE